MELMPAYASGSRPALPGAVIAGIPQDLKFRGEKTLAIIGDNTVIRECVTVDAGVCQRVASCFDIRRHVFIDK